MKYVGDETKSVVGMYPQHISGEATIAHGTAVDRRGYGSGNIHVGVGDFEGSPTNVLYTIGLQECDTETGTFTGVSLSGETYTISGECSASGVLGDGLEIAVDLKGCKAWVRPVVKVEWTGGSTPKGVVGVDLVLGEANIVPAS